MVNIRLNSEWSLESDSNNWILSLGGRPKKFFSSIPGAINGFFEMKLRDSNAKTMSGLIEYHKRLRYALNKALTPLKIEVVSLEDTSKLEKKKNERKK